MRLPDEARTMGLASYRLPYMDVAKVDDAVRRGQEARRHGARASYRHSQWRPLAVLGEPLGAAFAVHEVKG